MKKSEIILLVLLASVFSNGFARESGINKNRPELSLTLIPPSPVTDKIDLDNRAGLWNNTNTDKTVTVFFTWIRKKLQIFCISKKSPFHPELQAALNSNGQPRVKPAIIKLSL